MANKNSSPTNTKEQASLIRKAWSNIDKDMTYGGMSLAEFTTLSDDLEKTEAFIQDMEDQLTSARNLRISQRTNLWKGVKRARNGAKAQHGDDSDEFERFGGTRISERATPKKKAMEKDKPTS